MATVPWPSSINKVAVVTARTREKLLLIFTPLDKRNKHSSPNQQGNTCG
jgi:hypothetical protein